MDATIISFVIGLATGVISSYFVTQYFRKVDEKNKAIETKSKHLNDFTDYLTELMAEAKTAEEDGDYTELKRLIRKKTPYLFNIYSVLGENAAETFYIVESKLHSIEQDLSDNSLPINDIRTELTNISISMLPVFAASMIDSCNK